MAIRSTPIFASTCALVLAAALAGAACAATAVPEPIKKLTGSSDETAKSVMAQHGYAFRSEKSSWGRKYTYWWSDKVRQCVQLMSLAGRVYGVEAKGESDCRYAGGGTAGGGTIDPLELVGQPRAAVQARLERAGFRAIETDMSKGDMIYIRWFDGHQCLAGNIANDRYEMLQTMPLNQCKR